MLNKKRATIRIIFPSLRRRGLRGGSLLMACFVLLIFSANSVFASGITAARIFELTNQSRATENVSALEISPELQSAAKAKANDMLHYDYFAHISPNEVEPWFWISEAGYNYEYAGENLAMDFLTSEGVHKGLINSATHKANIVNSNYKEIGIAVVSGEFEGRITTIIVEMFGAEILPKLEKLKIEKPEEFLEKPVVLSSARNIAKDSPSSSAGRPVSNSNLAMVDLENLDFVETGLKPVPSDIFSKEEKETTLVYSLIDDFVGTGFKPVLISDDEKISPLVFQKFENNSGEILIKLDSKGLSEIEAAGSNKEIFQNSKKLNLEFPFLLAYVWTAFCALFTGVIREV